MREILAQRHWAWASSLGGTACPLPGFGPEPSRLKPHGRDVLCLPLLCPLWLAGPSPVSSAHSPAAQMKEGPGSNSHAEALGARACLSLSLTVHEMGKLPDRRRPRRSLAAVAQERQSPWVWGAGQSPPQTPDPESLLAAAPTPHRPSVL